mmetsp:Transcript_9295/g.56577  ORF Transcript_9295/g.56577 Transcript_9295/m.56577 type:complete len:202 (-) Transcript_9295:1181-1786(-)|eukprot:CAMPEP_0183831116 /NCGR_PEP_ID=MMETSP0807_2-20130328/4422_1 /TAXON_ID=88271 /ORGANISM="Picocystis salinarum, Strain CCMP1897" /LENGTH=201 /DNA_ID=CAMNT_0026076525 /DNA_START=196 /DNA_END=801 /DNA_ORIENTATION=+
MKCNADIQIVGKKVVLVPYKKKHVQKYHEWMQDPSLQEATASEPLSIDEEYSMQKSWAEDEDKCTFIVLERPAEMGEMEEVDAMVGDVNLFFNDVDDAQAAEVEVMIAEERARGNGLGVEAVTLMMAYAYSRLKTRKFSAKIGDSNHASLSMFRKRLGFEFASRSEVFRETTLELLVDDEAKGKSVVDQASKLCIQRYSKE